MRRFGSALLVGLVLSVTVGLVPAGAAQVSGPPDGAGKYAYCNGVATRIGASNPHNGYWRFAASCNRGAEVYNSMRITWATGYNPTGFGYPATYGGFARSVTLTSDTPQRSVKIPPNTTTPDFGQFSAQQWTEPGNATYEVCTGPVVGGNATGTCRATSMTLTVDPVDSNSATASMTPPWPDTYFAGGAGNGPAEVALPTVTCERTLSQQSDGSWIVNLSAAGSGVPTGATSSGSGWSVPWLAGVQPATSSLAVPAGPPLGFTLTYNVTYTVDVTEAFPEVDEDLPAAMALLSHTQVWWTRGEETTAGGVDGFIYYTWKDGVKRAMKRLVDGTAQVSLLNATAGLYDYKDVGVVTSSTVTAGVLSYMGVSWDPLTPAQGAEVVWSLFDPAAAGDWTPGVTEQVVTASCRVLLDLDRPSTGSSGSTDPPVAPGDAPEGSGGEGCSAGPLGSVPVIGGLFDATARLACSLGDLFGKLGRLLISLLIPEGGIPWSTLTDGITTKFPFSLFDGIGTFATTISDAATNGLENGTACPVLGFGSAVKLPGAGDTEALNVRLPTPSDSGCPGLDGGTRVERDNEVGDLFGWRDFVRAMFTVALWLGLMVKLIAAFSPARETGLVEGG